MQSTMDLFRQQQQQQQSKKERLHEEDEDEAAEGHHAVIGGQGDDGVRKGGAAQQEVQRYGMIRRHWEFLRDVCDIIQVGAGGGKMMCGVKKGARATSSKHATSYAS